MPIRIAPSILAGDLSNLGEAVRLATEGGADLIHLDVIDGRFAPNITFGHGTVKALRRHSDLPFDTHLMLSEPAKYVAKFIEAGANIVHVHAEAIAPGEFDEIRRITHAASVRLGIALKPATSLPAWAASKLEEIDVLLVMTVNPGFSGQILDESTLPKLLSLAQLMKAKGGPADIEVDGGVEAENVVALVSRGANVLVAGAGVYAQTNVRRAIQQLRDRAMQAVVTI